MVQKVLDRQKLLYRKVSRGHHLQQEAAGQEFDFDACCTADSQISHLGSQMIIRMDTVSQNLL